MKFFSKFLKVYRLILEGVSADFIGGNTIINGHSLKLKLEYIFDNNMQVLMKLDFAGCKAWIDYLRFIEDNPDKSTYVIDQTFKYQIPKMINPIEVYFIDHIMNIVCTNKYNKQIYNGLSHGLVNNPIDEEILMTWFNNICVTLLANPNIKTYAQQNKRFACFFTDNNYQVVVQTEQNIKNGNLRILFYNFFEVTKEDWNQRIKKKTLYSEGKQEIVIPNISSSCLYKKSANDILTEFFNNHPNFWPDSQEDN